MKVKIYVEGGGDSKEQHARCREGFRKLIDKAGFKERSPAIVACGGRSSAFDKFKTAVASDVGAYAILLVDSEDPVKSADDKPDSWSHLQSRDGWERPANVMDDQAQLMATCMETWIMADRAALKNFFGQKLQTNALFPEKELESRTRHEVQEKLEHATRDCGKDRGYAKGNRSFKMLAELKPETLKKHLPHFRRFIETLDKYLK